MKIAKALLIALLVSVSLAPDASLALKALAGSHPCGKIICCCPEMCKKISQHGAKCRMAEVLTCGFRTKSVASTALFSNDSSEALMMPMGSPVLVAGLRTEHRIALPEIQYASISRTPLDKPPSFPA